MEACASSHYWAREFSKCGHEVRLIPPIYVKPFVKRQKNDAADAEAIVEAVLRPNMSFVAAKSSETQTPTMMVRIRDVFEYINGFYNPRRRQSTLGWKSRLVFERKAA